MHLLIVLSYSLLAYWAAWDFQSTLQKGYVNLRAAACIDMRSVGLHADELLT